MFSYAASHSQSVREMLESLNLRAAGGNYASARKWSAVHGIPLPSGKGEYQLQAARRKMTRPDSAIFIKGSRVSGHELKKRLRRLAVDWGCVECGLREIWNGLPITLQVDHMNGDHSDNRLDNLRILCPNCHSQTPTFAGRNIAVLLCRQGSPGFEPGLETLVRIQPPQLLIVVRIHDGQRILRV